MTCGVSPFVDVVVAESTMIEPGVEMAVAVAESIADPEKVWILSWVSHRVWAEKARAAAATRVDRIRPESYVACRLLLYCARSRSH